MSNTARKTPTIASFLLAILLVGAPVTPAPAQVLAPQGDVIATFTVRTPEYRVDEHGLTVPGGRINDVPGAPALPVWSTLVELPPAGGWEVTFESQGARWLAGPVAVPAVPAPLTVRPGPTGHDLDQIEAVPVADQPDPAIYAADVLYPAAPVQPGDVAQVRGQRLLSLRVFPFQYNPVTGEVRFHPDLTIVVRRAAAEPKDHEALTTAAARDVAGKGPAANNAAVVGGAIRIRTSERGFYRLTYTDLVTAGVPVTTTGSATFAMSYLGQPVAIQVTDQNQNDCFDPGDLVIFYAVPYQGRYMTQNIYLFTYGGAAGARMSTRTATPAGTEPVVTTITRTLHVEYDREYRSEYQRPNDVDHWFDTPLYPAVSAPTATVTYPLTLTHPLATGDVLLRAVVHGGVEQGTDPDQSIAVALNGLSVGAYEWKGSTDFTITANLPASRLAGVSNRISLTAALSQLPGLSYYWVSPDWVELVYPALAAADSDRLYIEGLAGGAKEVRANGFSAGSIRAYDVSDPWRPVQLRTIEARPAGSTWTAHVWDQDAPASSYFLSTEAALLVPDAVEPDVASAWRSPDHAADYIAIVHRTFWDAIRPLLDYRAAEGLRVAKVDVQDIYDEFSYGRLDPEAIREFLAYAYSNWNTGETQRPEYVLLVGAGHYDFKGVSGTQRRNLIPPYLVNVDPWIGETAADNRFVSVDGSDDYLPDMHVGRIPAQTPADVTAVVSKTIAYETTAPAGDWQRRVAFVADNCADPAGNFHSLTDEVRLHWLPPTYLDRRIYYGPATQCPQATQTTPGAVKTAIKRVFSDGALLLQWFGHASRFRWGSVTGIFNVDDPVTLDSSNRWPVSFSYSCWSGYFISIYNDWPSLSETLLLTPDRASVADMSPSGLHVGDALVVLNEGVVEAALRDRIDRLGRATDAAKLYYFANTSRFRDVIDTSILFGDPALHLRLPPPPKVTYLPLVPSE